LLGSCVVLTVLLIPCEVATRGMKSKLDAFELSCRSTAAGVDLAGARPPLTASQARSWTSWQPPPTRPPAARRVAPAATDPAKSRLGSGNTVTSSRSGAGRADLSVGRADLTMMPRSS